MDKPIPEAVVKAAQTAYVAACAAGQKPCPRCGGTRRERDNYTECSVCEGAGWKWDESAPSPMQAALTAAQQQDEVGRMDAIMAAYTTWPADLRAKLSLHDLRRMTGWTPPAAQQQGQAVAHPVAWRILWTPQFPETSELTSDGERILKVQALDDPPYIEPLYAAPPSAPVGVEALRDLRDRVLPAALRHHAHGPGYIEEAQEIVTRALAQQPAAVDGVVGRYEDVTPGVAYIRFDNDDAPEWDGKMVLLSLATQHQEPKS